MKNLIIDGKVLGVVAGYSQQDVYGEKMWDFRMEDGGSKTIWGQDIRNWNPNGGPGHDDHEILTYYGYRKHSDGYSYKIVFRDTWFRVMRTKNERTTYGKRYSKEGYERPCEAYEAIQKMQLTFG